MAVARPSVAAGGPRDRAAGARTGELFAAHGRMVFAVCRAILLDPDEAEDATQTAFLSAHEALVRGAVVRDPGAWLATIARNECRARVRARRGEPLSLRVEELAGSVTADDDLDRRTVVAQLRAAIASLPEKQREAVVLRDLYGLRYGEICTALDLSRPSVEALLFRARRTLRVRLRPVGGVALGIPVAVREGLAQAVPWFAPGSGAGASAAVGTGLLAKLSASTVAKLAAGAVAAGVAGPALVALDVKTETPVGIGAGTVAGPSAGQIPTAPGQSGAARAGAATLPAPALVPTRVRTEEPAPAAVARHGVAAAPAVPERLARPVMRRSRRSGVGAPAAEPAPQRRPAPTETRPRPTDARNRPASAVEPSRAAAETDVAARAPEGLASRSEPAASLPPADESGDRATSARVEAGVAGQAPSEASHTTTR